MMNIKGINVNILFVKEILISCSCEKDYDIKACVNNDMFCVFYYIWHIEEIKYFRLIFVGRSLKLFLYILYNAIQENQ